MILLFGDSVVDFDPLCVCVGGGGGVESLFCSVVLGVFLV